MFEMQVLVENHATHKKEWKSVRPTGGQPYQYETREEAQRTLEMCYADALVEEVRVIEVQ